MALTPISIKDRGDRQKRLADHIQLVAGVDAAGQPQIQSVSSSGAAVVSNSGPSWVASFGVAGARVTSADASGAPINVTDVPTTGKKLVITDIEISVDTAMRVDLIEETSGTVIATKYMAANSSVNLVTQSKRKLATANKRLQVQTSAAGNISVGAFYYSET